MARKTYTEEEVLRSLSKKNSVQVNKSQSTINISTNKGDLGNGSWGKIDYLTKVHGYRIIKTF